MILFLTHSDTLFAALVSNPRTMSDNIPFFDINPDNVIWDDEYFRGQNALTLPAELIKETENQNTRAKTDSNMKILRDWLWRELEEERGIEEIPAEELDQHLQHQIGMDRQTVRIKASLVLFTVQLARN